MKEDNLFQKFRGFLYHGANFILNFDSSNQYKYNQMVSPLVRRLAIFVFWVISVALSSIIGPYAFVAASVVGTLNLITGIASAYKYSSNSGNEIKTVKPNSLQNYGATQSNAKYQNVNSKDPDNNYEKQSEHGTHITKK